MSQLAADRFCHVRHGDVLHAGAEQHHAAVVGADLGFRRRCRISRASRSASASWSRAVGVGLGAIFIAYPVLQTILKYAGAAYLIYLASSIAMSGAVGPDRTTAAVR